MKRLQRVIVATLMLLAASAALNFMIAWACVIASPSNTAASAPPPELDALIGRASPVDPGWTVYRSGLTTGTATGFTEAYGDDGLGWEDGDVIKMYLHRSFKIWTAGWPLRAVSAAETSLGGSPTPAPQLHWGLRIHHLTSAAPGQPTRPLPFFPLWRGLVINSSIYAGAMALICLPLARVFMRPRAGHCRGCGYDLSGVPTGVCPECGKGPV